MSLCEGFNLRWMQRMSLIRHNLHAALRTRDFSFFKTLQASIFLDGTNYVAILSHVHEEADSILHALHDLNLGLVYVHQDSFKSVYDSIRESSVTSDSKSRLANIRVEISQQRQVADMAIDKIVNSAISLIEQQLESTKESVANVWMLGVTVIADSLQVRTLAFEKLEDVDKIDGFTFLEYAWQDVQSSVEASVSALRGVLNMMSTTSIESFQRDKYTDRSHHRRSSSISSGSSWIRKLSTVLTNGNSASTASSVETV
jgi:hypothetical protein